MRLLLLAGVLLLLPVFALSAPAQTAKPSNGDGCVAHAQAISRALQHGSFNAARIANFSPEMKKALAAQMNQFWSLLASHFQGFNHSAESERSFRDGQWNIILLLHFAHGSENLHVTCGPDGKVVGLFMTPGLNDPQK